MAKKAPPKKSTAKKASKRKKGTYYDLHQPEMRKQQQDRRAAIKAGKIVPGTRKFKGESTPKPKPKPKPKRESKPMPKPKPKPKKRNEGSDRTEYKTQWARNKKEEQRLKEIEEFLKEYPIPKL